MSGRSYVQCLVHRGVMPRELTIPFNQPTAGNYRRRHVCFTCIRALENARSLAIDAAQTTAARRTMFPTIRPVNAAHAAPVS